MTETKGIKLVLEVTVAELKGRLRPPKLVSQNNPSASFQAAKAAEALGPQPLASLTQVLGHTESRGKKREQAGLCPALSTGMGPKEGQRWKKISSFSFRFTAGSRPHSRHWGQP